MAEEVEETEGQFDSEYVTAACYCLETLKDVDTKMFSKAEEERIISTRRRMLRLIHASAKAMHDNYFELPDNVDDGEED